MKKESVPTPIPAQTAAYLVAQAHDWQLNNYELNTRLYFLQLFHLAQTGGPLMEGEFSSYLHGPKLRGVYNKFKIFEAKPIPNPGIILPEVSRQHQEFISALSQVLREFTESELITVYLARGVGGSTTPLKNPPSGEIVSTAMLEIIYQEYFAGNTPGAALREILRVSAPTSFIFPGLATQARARDLEENRRDAFLHVSCVCVLMAFIVDSGVFRTLVEYGGLTATTPLTAYYAGVAFCAIALLGFLRPRRFLYLKFCQLAQRFRRPAKPIIQA